jgi:hypothetical protein
LTLVVAEDGDKDVLIDEGDVVVVVDGGGGVVVEEVVLGVVAVVVAGTAVLVAMDAPDRFL